MISHQEGRIAIDLVPYAPGEGGSGGGIWTYAKSLVESIDRQVNGTGLDIYCLTSGDNLDYLSNINVVNFKYKNSPILKRLLWTHVELPIWCRKNDVKVLHKLSTEVPLFSSSKIITTVHDFVNKYYEESNLEKEMKWRNYVARKYFDLIEKVSFKKSSHIIVPTKFIKDQATKIYDTRPSKIRVTYEGVKVDESNNTINKRRNGKRVLYVAGFYPHKGHVKAIDSFDILMDRYNFSGENPSLVFRGHVSDERYFRRVKDRISNSKFKDKISVEGYDPNISISDIYNNADVLMSLSGYEGFGLPLIEAQEHGVPVVASRIPTFNETVGYSALLVDRDNSQEVADKLYKLLTNKSMYKKYVDLGFDNSSKFRWFKTASKTINCYSEIV